MTKIIKPTTEEKFQNVIQKNTFFFHNNEFEEDWESYVSSMTQSLLILKNDIENRGIKKEVFVEFIVKNENSIDTLLALIGFSKEMFLRLITFIRVYGDKTLEILVKKGYWPNENFSSEWSLNKITSLAREKTSIAEGLINLFFEGSTVKTLRKVLPLFEYKKLDINKLSFKIESMIDTIVRYKVKGSYSAQKGNNPETLIEKILKKIKIKYTRGKLVGVRRDMDFIVPNKKTPEIIIESSYVATTSSGMGDKAKTEITVGEEIIKNYPNAIFLGFVDGIGWYVRQGDLARIVSAFEDVFTFNKNELIRFEYLLLNTLSGNCYEDK